MKRVTEWLRANIKLDQFDVAAVLINELHAVSTAKEQLEKTFVDHDFCSSFQRSQVILGLEVWTAESLILLRDWLAQKCCQIDRYHVIVSGHPGIKAWWDR
jgi:hypothetical protein